MEFNGENRIVESIWLLPPIRENTHSRLFNLEIGKSINQLTVFTTGIPANRTNPLKISSILTATPANRAKRLTNQPLFALIERFGIDEIANQLLWTAKRC